MDRSTYAISASYDKEEGIVNIENKSMYERIGLRSNTEQKYKSILKFGQNINYTHTTSRGIGVGNMYNNTIRSLINACPLIPAYDDTESDGFGRGETARLSPDQGNPLATIHYNYNSRTNTDNLLGDFYAELEIIKGLKFRSDYGANITFSTYQSYTPAYTITQSEYNTTSFGQQNMSRYYSSNFDNTLTYQKDFGEHNLLVMVGMNAQDNRFFYENAKKYDGNFDDLDHSVLSNFNTVATASDITGSAGKGDSRFSYFGRLSYNYGEKYMFNSTLRRDGSSRFGKNNRFGYFPAASVGWVVSKEKFMESASWLDFLKLRASWAYMATLSSDNRYYYFGSAEAKSVGTSPNILANPNLKWEASTQTNIGFDSRFLKHFHLTAEYYDKTSKNWIIKNPVAAVTGLSGSDPYINGGNVSNKGVEFDLGYSQNIGDLSFDITANFAYNKNNVTSVPNSDGIIHGSSSVLFNGSSEFYRVQSGYPIGYFWGLKTDGLFQTQSEVDSYINKGKVVQAGAKPGDVKFVDTNKDGVIDDNDKTKIGDPNPHYLYGLNISVSYKGFDFAMNIQGQGGNQIVENLRSTERWYNNYTTEILDRWTGPGTSNKIPRLTRGDETNQNWNRVSDLYVHNADFLRVKSLNIGYDFKKLLTNLPVQQLRLYFSATNLMTFTKYKGMDPEVGYGSSYDSSGLLIDGYASGVDIGSYPTARTYLVGVNVKF